VDIGPLTPALASLPDHVAHRTRRLFANDPSTVCMRVYQLHDLHVAYPESGGAPAFDRPGVLPVVAGLYTTSGALVDVLEFEPPNNASTYVGQPACLAPAPATCTCCQWSWQGA
jgi:hypothetical protein